MKFSHTADCHVGGHRDPRLKVLTEQAFERFIDESLAEHVDFIIIAGDLFNTAIPGIDTLKFVVTQMGKAKRAHVPIYAIPGSHDYSPSGKTMLDVLEEAGLLVNVCKGTVTNDNKLKLSFTIDEKTGVKLTGVIGKRGMLDRHIYEDLDHSIENELGKKIFLFHTALTELKPQHLQEMESYPISFLPKNFLYYAGGHVHIVQRYEEKGYSNVIYPGPLFPNSFSELEKLHHGGYYIYDNGNVVRKEISLRHVILLHCDVNGKTSQEANKQLLAIVDAHAVQQAIVLLRIEGTLQSGSTHDVDVRHAVQILEEKEAHIVLRNTTRLAAADFIAVQAQHDEPTLITERALTEHAKQLAFMQNTEQGIALTRQMLTTLGREPLDGEKVYEYQETIVTHAVQQLSSLSLNEQKPKREQ